jgi:hypothetical protein
MINEMVGVYHCLDDELMKLRVNDYVELPDEEMVLEHMYGENVEEAREIIKRLNDIFETICPLKNKKG